MFHIGSLAGSHADGMPVAKRVNSWSPPQAALKIARLTRYYTSAPTDPQKSQTIIIIVVCSSRIAQTKCIGVSTTSTTLEQLQTTMR